MSAPIVELFETYRHAYVAAALIAVGCAVVGVHVVLRRVAFVGVATAQVAAAGTALAFLLHAPPVAGAFAATLLGLLLFATGRPSPRLTRDGLVGVAFALASALAVLCVSRSGAELDQVEHIVYGSLLFTTGDQVVLLAVATVAVLLTHAAFGREFLMVSFDAETARTLGVRARVFELLFWGSLGVVVALAIGVAGSLLAFAFLILPPLCGLLLGDRLLTVTLAAAAIALVTAVAGVLNAVAFDVPTGPAVVVTAALALPCAALARRSRKAGAALAIVLLLGTAAATIERFGGETRTTAAPANSASPFRIDLDLAVHDRTVRRGETLEVDFVARATGTIEGDLHLLVECGGVLALAPLSDLRSHRAGRLELDTSDLEPGSYTLAVSLWTGPPLDPDDETELVPQDAVAAPSVTVEVTP